MKGILIMINNYLHDLSTAMLFVSVMGAIWLDNGSKSAVADAVIPLKRVSGRFRLLAWFSLVLVILFGYVRAVNYMEFEWNTAVAHGQIPALVVKHIVLVGVTVFGIHRLVKIGK